MLINYTKLNQQTYYKSHKKYHNDYRIIEDHIASIFFLYKINPKFIFFIHNCQIYYYLLFQVFSKIKNQQIPYFLNSLDYHSPNHFY